MANDLLIIIIALVIIVVLFVQILSYYQERHHHHTIIIITSSYKLTPKDLQLPTLDVIIYNDDTVINKEEHYREK